MRHAVPLALLFLLPVPAGAETTSAIGPLFLHRFDAPAGATAFGRSVSAGDLDGDGIPEVIVGGNPTCVYSGATRAVLFTIPGFDPGFGIEVDVVGDRSGDGIPDLLIASPESAATLYSGSDGSPLGLGAFDYATGLDAGGSMAHIGDVDGDGLGDFVIGENGSLSGSPTTRLHSSIFEIPALSVAAGHSVAAMGDVNGDDVPDFAAGRYGSILVASGADGSTLFSVPGHDASLGAADLDGDGVKDLLLTMPHVSPAGVFAIVVAWSGATGDSLGRVAVAVPECVGGCFFHAGATGIGDADADGDEEFAVGVVAVKSGTAGAGAVAVFAGGTLEMLLHLRGPTPSSAFGWGVMGTEDIDGDGGPDLLIGAPGPGALSGGSSGSAYLYRLGRNVTGVDPLPDTRWTVRPNPIRRGSPVRLQLEVSGEGRVTGADVYDLRGRLVRRLSTTSGVDLSWDGRDARTQPVPSGLYFVRPRDGGTPARVVVLP